MASMNEVLAALCDTSRSCPLKVKELAKGLEANPPTLSVQLHRLSKEGLVAKKGKKGGWFITKQGSQRLRVLTTPLKEVRQTAGISLREKLTGELNTAIYSTKGTTYGKFLEIGKQLGVPPGLVLLTADHLADLGDYANPQNVWLSLCDMEIIRWDMRKVWFYAWCSFMKIDVSQELRREIENSRERC